MFGRSNQLIKDARRAEKERPVKLKASRAVFTEQLESIASRGVEVERIRCGYNDKPSIYRAARDGHVLSKSVCEGDERVLAISFTVPDAGEVELTARGLIIATMTREGIDTETLTPSSCAHRFLGPHDVGITSHKESIGIVEQHGDGVLVRAPFAYFSPAGQQFLRTHMSACVDYLSGASN